MGPGLWIGGFLILFFGTVTILALRERRRGARWGDRMHGDGDSARFASDDHRSYYDGGDSGGGGDCGGGD